MAEPDSERHRQISDLFLRVCELPGTERAALLDEACAGDPVLRREVESLLARDREAERCLATGEIERGMRATALRLAASRERDHPDHIGPYRIVSVLGEGGMGSVYLAERDGPVHRRVALKIIKLGMDTKQVIQRFEAERRVLQSLDHRGIAAVLDAGATERGRPYFVMEYVPGIPISRYCDRHRLGLRDRLELFVQVCEAAGHAHGQGIVHRDLKPANILVSESDAGPRPRIIDFGIAKAMKRGITPTTMLTAGNILMGTPEYMSPEQVEMGSIDARSDVYSLGLVLYELLTGVLPFDREELRRAGLQKLLRCVQCEPAVSPSRRVKDLGEKAARLASRRSVDPGAWTAALRGDLDRIVLMALEKAPSKRYRSAAHLGEDVVRHLRGRRVLSRTTERLRPRGAIRLGRPALLTAISTILCVAAAVSASWLLSERARNDAARRAASRTLFRVERTEAERCLGDARAAFEAAPDLPETRLVWAQAQFRTGQETANQDLERAAILTLEQGTRKGRSSWAIRALLDEMVARRNRSPANAGTPWRAETRDTARDWYLRSLATMDEETATESARRAVKEDPDHVLAWERLAFLWERTGRYDHALSAARRLMDLGEDTYGWTLFRGHVLTEQGRYREAVAAYTSIVEVEPSSPEARFSSNRLPLFHRGAARLCLLEYAEAVDDYSAALERIWPTSRSWSRFYRATPLWILGRREEAAADLREYRRLEGRASYADARLFLVRREEARLLEQQGLTGAARRIAEDSGEELSRARTRVAPTSWLGTILACLAGEIEPDRLVTLARDDHREHLCEAYYYAAEVCLMRGELEQARAWYRRCVATGLVLDPDTFPPEPMNEYHLALWRLAGLE